MCHGILKEYPFQKLIGGDIALKRLTTIEFPRFLFFSLFLEFLTKILVIHTLLLAILNFDVHPVLFFFIIF